MAFEDPTYTPWSWVPQNWIDQPAQDPLAPPMPAPTQEMATPTLPPPPEPAPGPVGTAPPVNAFGMPLDAPSPVPETPAQEQAPPPPTFAPMQPETWGAMPPLPAPTPQPRTGESDQTPLNEDELLKLAHNDPVAYAAFNAQKDAERDQQFREKNARLEIDHAARAEQDWADYQKAKHESDAMLMQLDADAQALAAEKPKKYEPGALDLIAAVAGMIGAPATGGQNVGLNLVMKRIDDHATMQREEYARKKDLIDTRRNTYARLRAAGYDDFQATSAFRMASMERARQQMLTEAQNYDPQGSTARKIANAALQMEQNISAARTAAGQQALESRLKLAQIAKAEAEAAKLNRAGVGGAAGQKFPPEHFAAQGLSAPPPGVMFTEKEYDQWRQRGGGKVANDAVSRKQEADASKAEADAAAAQSGYAIANPETGDPLINKDDKPFVVMDAEERKRLRGIGAAARNIRLLADKMAELKKKYGGAITSLGSDEAQDLKRLASMVDFETFKAFDLGAPSDGDKALAEGARGGVDLTSFIKNATHGIQGYAESVEQKALGHWRSAGYTGKPIKFARAADLSTPKPTLVQELTERAMQSPYAVGDLASPIDAANAMSPEQVRVNKQFAGDVNGLAAQAEGAPDEQTKRAARAALEKLAKDHPTKEGQRLAAEALQKLPGIEPPRAR